MAIWNAKDQQSTWDTIPISHLISNAISENE